MNKTFMSLLGAAALLASATTSAKAVDYTWTVSGLTFGPVMNYDTFAGGGWEDGEVIGGPDNGTFTGTFVLRENGGDWGISSMNLTSTTGSYMAGTVYTMFSNTSDNFATSLELTSNDNEYGFIMSWGLNALKSSLTLGKVVDLDPVSSYEYQQEGALDDCLFVDGGTEGVDCQNYYVRANGAFTPVLADNNEWGTPGVLTLTNIYDPQAVPEPATMALLGTGLLGLFAARRRRAA